MSKVITGTKDLKGVITITKPVGGTGRIRCPKCHGIAYQTVDTMSGTTVWRCGGCSRQFTRQPMGAPASAGSARPTGAQRP